MARSDRRFLAPSRAVVTRAHHVLIRQRMVPHEEWLERKRGFVNILRAILIASGEGRITDEERTALLRHLQAVDDWVGHGVPADDRGPR